MVKLIKYVTRSLDYRLKCNTRTRGFMLRAEDIEQIFAALNGCYRETITSEMG